MTEEMVDETITAVIEGGQCEKRRVQLSLVSHARPKSEEYTRRKIIKKIDGSVCMCVCVCVCVCVSVRVLPFLPDTENN